MAASRSSIAQRRKAARDDGGIDYSVRRAEIVRVATEVFRTKGYASATLNDIASILGTDRASLYYYVASKDELFQECIHEALAQNSRDALLIAQSGGSPRQKLHDLIDMLIRSQEQYYPTMFVYIQEDMARMPTREAEWSVAMVAATRVFERYFIETINEGVRDGTFRSDLSSTLIANAVFGMTQWTHRWWVPGEKYSADQLIRTFSSVLFEGVAGPGDRA